MDETTRMLELLNTAFPDITTMSPLDARAVVDARVRTPANLDAVASAEDQVVGEPGTTVRIRVYRPHEPRPAPATVYLHGGGFLHGSIESHDGFCREWARGTGSVVVSVDMRLAPEHTVPAPADDVVTAIDAVTAAGLDGGRGIVIAGDSSGGNLAAVVALALRDRGDSPLVGQILAYPFLDPTTSRPSYTTRAEGYFVTARQLRYYWSTYLRADPAEMSADWRIAPALAATHEGLPPAIVLTAGLDPLTDEGTTYAQTLAAAGVPVVHRHYPDQFHGFLTIPGYGPGIAASGILWSDFARIFRTAPTLEEVAR